MNGLRINLGCGINAPRHWINLDSSFRVWLDKVPLLHLFGYRRRFPLWVRRYNVTKRLPFPDHSAEFIYSSHMIEHLTREEAEQLLRECSRVLAPSGRIRIMTPNVRFSVENYLARRKDAAKRQDAADLFMNWLGLLEESDDSSGYFQNLVRRFQRKNVHKWLYDEFSLPALMESSGFHGVVAKDDWVSDFPDLDALEPSDLREGSVCAEGYR